jgi:hypothetical protein
VSGRAQDRQIVRKLAVGFAIVGAVIVFFVALAEGLFVLAAVQPAALGASVVGAAVAAWWLAGLATRPMLGGGAVRAAIAGALVAIATLITAALVGYAVAHFVTAPRRPLDSLVGLVADLVGWTLRLGAVPAALLGAGFGLLARSQQRKRAEARDGGPGPSSPAA